MKIISQRELRNDNAEVIRGVEGGETYTVTRHGVPVARLLPVSGESDLRCDRPVRTRTVWATRPRRRSGVPTAVLLDELRGER